MVEGWVNSLDFNDRLTLDLHTIDRGIVDS